MAEGGGGGGGGRGAGSTPYAHGLEYVSYLDAAVTAHTSITDLHFVCCMKLEIVVKTHFLATQSRVASRESSRQFVA